MVTLDDLLGDDALGLRPVVDVRRSDELSWAATSELVDPSPFLGPGEVLLTTGLETTGWAGEWDGFVARLAGVGVLAIGLAVDLTYAAAPVPLVEACRTHAVGLFEVPRATTFVAITRRVARLLQAEDESATRAALAQQRELTQAALREDDPGLLVTAVGRIGHAAALVDPDGAVRVGPAGTDPGLLVPEAVAEALDRIRGSGLRAAAGISVPDGELMLHPLGVRGRPARYLVTGFRRRVTDEQRSSVMTAVALLSTAEERRRAGRETERQVRVRAIELLVTGDVRTAGVLLEAAGGRAQVPARSVVVRARGSAAQREDGLGSIEDDCVAGISEGEVDELVLIAPARAAAGLADALGARGLRVGVGEPVAPAEIPRSHRAAGHAVALASAERPVVHWSHDVRRGVLALLDDGRGAAFADSWLAPLDAADDPELIATLRSFLAHHGSLLQVAEDLRIHRNTARKRLDRIEALLGRSLADPQTRVDAWIALEARAR